MLKADLRKVKHYIQDIGTRGYVLMLHRVAEIDRNGISMNENMKVSPSFLENFIQKYRNEYDFIAATEIKERLKSRCRKKFIVFTMDDGYLDNFTEAFPVFEKYNVPFTVFIATDFPNKKCFLWWYTLGNLVLKNNSVKTSDGIVYDCSSLKLKNTAFEKLRARVLCLDQNNLIAEFIKLFRIDSSDIESINDKYCMDWKNIAELHDSPLVTIGAHTARHCNLRALKSACDVEKEINEGVSELKNHIADYNAEVFAYPFGSPFEIGKREIKTAKKIGFSNAFIGYGRGVKRNSDLYALPRIAFTENFDFSILK